jgi:hypothetical protein
MKIEPGGETRPLPAKPAEQDASRPVTATGKGEAAVDLAPNLRLVQSIVAAAKGAPANRPAVVQRAAAAPSVSNEELAAAMLRTKGR